MTQWIQATSWPVAWISLDEGDNLPTRFARYIIAAVQKISPAIGQSALEWLDSVRPDLEEMMGSLANDLGTFGHPFLIVLDDYYMIHEAELHRAIQHLLDALPPNGRLTFLSREDPPLPLARRRARGEMVELRLEDLRFSMEEAASFLNQAMGLNLTAKQIKVLEERTEGWIAGLQMAALAMGNTEDRDQFIQAFSGSQRFVLDYLMEEVLSHQPVEIKHFLLRTSMLEKMRADLCDKLVTENQESRTENRQEVKQRISNLGSRFSTSESILSYLEHSNLFLIPLDDRREWYRYHHLFADLLKMRLKSTHPEWMPELRRRASLWFEQHGDPGSALEYALQGEDFERAADLIEMYIVAKWREVDPDFFFAVRKIPDLIIHERPTLCLHSAWSCVLSGQVHRVPRLVDAAEEKLKPLLEKNPSSRELQGSAAFARVLRAYVDDLANQPFRLDDTLRQAVESVPKENVGMRNSIAVVLGSIYYMEGDFRTAPKYFADAIERDKEANGTNAIPIAASRWARMLIIQGKLNEAIRLCRQNEAYIRERGSRRFYIPGNLNIFSGHVLREWGRLEEAEKEVREGQLLNQRWPVPQTQLVGLSALARILIAKNDLETARSTLEPGLEIVQKTQTHPDFLAEFQGALVRLLIAEDNLLFLENWIAEQISRLEKFPRDQRLTFRHEIEQMNLARAFIAVGRQFDAVKILKPLEKAAIAAGRIGHWIEIACLLAVSLSIEEGLVYLEQALRLAQPEDYLTVFVELSSHLMPALEVLRRKFKKQPEDKPILTYLLTLYNPMRPAELVQTDRAKQGLIEPLSQRELEVLRLVAAGLSNQQIADRLVISIRTVKKHLENVYSKLGVESRVQAITRARELSLL